MSKTGTPGDNAVMERFYNTFKNELIKIFSFKTDEELNSATKEYVHIKYNHLRPHTFNGKLTPNQKHMRYFNYK